MNTLIRRIILIFTILFIVTQLFSLELEASEKKNKYKLALSYYFDSRNFNTLNILTSGLLPLNLKFFGFIDIHSNHSESNNKFDLTRYFIEYRIIKPINPKFVFGLKGVGFEVEYNDFAGLDNNVIRFGITYKHFFNIFKNKGWLQWRFHPIESDGSGSQISVIYFIPFSKKIFLNGFVDYNINNNSSNTTISESQINFFLSKSIDFIIEGRFNEYEENNPSIKGVGIALGIKFKF